MKIRMVLGCSECETAYDYDKIEFDLTKNYAKIPVCKDDAEHSEGYSDVLIPVLLVSDFEKAKKEGIAMSEKEITKAFNEGDEEERHYWLGYQDALKDLKVEK